jgi:tetratricopeptide (TPR) repeat protein
LEQIGEGGFGVVYMAEQSRPIRRKVALKILKPGMDTRQVVGRFEAERQALAIMDHPNIARVFDGGATASGRPYFVMELVKGVPITEFCDQNHLAPRQRLELFVTVCQAVQHAHHKGIVHRDLKPSNVLVTVHDTTPVVKVIDFGVAKALGQELTERTLFTGFAQMIGTPLYMSPEQAGQSGLDVDTRSDIYSLGVLLYELLTGSTPFNKDRFKKAAYDEIRRIIREEEPPKPSTRLSESTEAMPSISAQRQTAPTKLTKLVRGELDWIVMRALDKDRNRRYETANGFAADLQRYLTDEPVQACPPSAAYRFRKYARRNRRGLAMAGVFAAAFVLIVAVVAGSVGWVARDQAARTAMLDDEVQRSLDEAGTLIESGKWPAAVTIIHRTDQLLETAGHKPHPQRLIELRKDLTMAQRLEEIYSQPKQHEFWLGREQDGEYARAFAEYGIDVASLPIATAAERVRSRSIARELAQALEFWSDMRRRAKNEQQPNWKQILQVAEAADPDPTRNRVRESLRTDNRQALKDLATAANVRQLSPGTLLLMSYALSRMGSRDQCLELLRRAHSEYPGDLWINDALGVTCLWDGDPSQWDDAVRYYTAALALRPGNPFMMNQVAEALRRKGSYEEAIVLSSQAIAIKPDHWYAWWNRGLAYIKLGRHDKALVDCSYVIDRNPNLVPAWHHRANVFYELKEWDKAIADWSKAIELEPDKDWIWGNRGNCYLASKRYDEAVGDYTKALEIKPNYAGAQVGLGNALTGKGDIVGAIKCYEAAIRLDPKSVLAHAHLGRLLLLEKKDYDAAAARYKIVVDLKPNDASAQHDLGLALYAKKDIEGALACYQAALKIDPNFVPALTMMGALFHNDRKEYDRAIALAQAVVKLRPNNAKADFNLAVSQQAAKDYEGAIHSYQAALRIDHKDIKANASLGQLLCDHKKDYEGAIACFETLIALNPNDAKSHTSLGRCHEFRKDFDNAITHYRAALGIDSASADLHNKVGHLLCEQKKDYSRGIECFKKAISIKPDLVSAHHNLGMAMMYSGDIEEAIRCYRAAIHFDSKYVLSHFFLGNALLANLDFEGAVRCFQTTIQLKPDHAEAHCNLGMAFQSQGRLAEALAEFQTGHQLGTQGGAQWPYPSAEWVRKAERRVKLDADFFSTSLNTARRPSDAAEQIELALVCQFPSKQLNVAAARLYAEAFAAEPKLAADLGTNGRSNAACAAALAGCGRGKDADKLEESERVHLRQQALEWLRADLAAWRVRLNKDGTSAVVLVRKTLKQWQQDVDYEGVRRPEALAELPAAEQKSWQMFWAEVAQTLVAMEVKDSAKLK